jgi:hypothetical protein
MSLNEDIQKKLRKSFEPSSMVQFRYRNYDMAVETDEQGNAMRLFMGKIQENGRIRGERYARVFIKDNEGHVVKDHWDKKGKCY